MSLNPINALSDGVSKGIDMFAIGLGDDMLNMSTAGGHLNATYEGKLLVDIATFTYNPFTDATVISALGESALIYTLFLILFVFIGGTYVQISRLRPARELLGSKLKQGLTLSEYFVVIFSLIILGPLVPFVMGCVLLFGYACSQLIMVNVLPSILFTPDNIPLYLFMCFLYVFMSGTFIWRTLVIGISVGYCLIIIVLLAIPYTRKLGVQIFMYFVLMVMMQPVILAITAAGTGIVCSMSLVLMGPWYNFCISVLSLFIMFVGFLFIFGPWTILKLLGKSKNIVKMVI